MANQNVNTTQIDVRPTHIAPVERPKQLAGSLGLELIEVDQLVKATQARQLFNVDGSGCAVAVLDTGLRTTHVDFAGRVVAQKNFTSDNNGDPDDASDGNGHGTNVAGIIAAGGIHTGIAPKANVIPLKVLGDDGSGSFAAVREALDWVKNNREVHNIAAVCMSLGDGANYQDDTMFGPDEIGTQIQDLRAHGVAVVIAAGNDFFTHNSQQGMGYPGILRGCVSVGAVYDNNEGGFSYASGAQAFSTAPDHITPFSQRLHGSVNADCRTDIFAPGAPVTSSGINDDRGESVQHGTSQATPVTTGVLLLMQHFYRTCADHAKLGHVAPTELVDQLVEWLRVSGQPINDGDNEDDNVANTGLDFIRIDALAALKTMHGQFIERLAH